MNKCIEELAESMCKVDDESKLGSTLPANLQDSYCYFLQLSDGGYNNDRFFHFFGKNGPQNHNLTEWNRTTLWKKYYELSDDKFVFCEDIFGTQFYFDLRGNRRVVKMLIPTNGKVTLCANSFEEFVTDEVLSDLTNREVRQFATKFFENARQKFRPFAHIACKIPTVLGGSDSDVNNLHLVDSSTNLRLLGQVIQQVKGLPAGTRINEIKIDEASQTVSLITKKPNWLKRMF